MVTIITNAIKISIRRSVFYEVNKYTVHAEIDCIRKVDRKILKKSILFVVKINNSEIISSKPCKSCEKAIRKYSLPKIYYS